MILLNDKGDAGHLIAELHNKISQNGSNLSDRLEDQLTGDFFGAIRYLPFEIGMRAVLSTVQFGNAQVNVEWANLKNSETGYSYNMEFWYCHKKGKGFILEFLMMMEQSTGIQCDCN